MKYRRKPIDRPVIDAIKLPDCYTWVLDDGTPYQMPHAQFEADYEPITRKPRTKKATGGRRKKKENGAGAAADAT